MKMASSHLSQIISHCVLSFSSNKEMPSVNRKSNAYKSFKKKTLNPFTKGMLDDACVFKSSGVLSVLSQPVLDELSQLKQAGTSKNSFQSIPVLSSKAIVGLMETDGETTKTSLALVIESILPFINDLYKTNLTPLDLIVSIEVGDTAFKRNVQKEKDVLVRLALGNNQLSFLPIADSTPITEAVIPMKLEDGTIFLMTEQALGVRSKTTPGYYALRYAFGFKACQKLSEDLVELQKTIPRLINCRVDSLRKLGVKDLKEWTEKPNNLYIGRKSAVFIENKRFPTSDSPYAEGKDEDLLSYRVGLLSKACQGVLNFSDLEGKTLGCWCSSEQCHGQVIIEEFSKQSYITLFDL